MKTKTSRVLSVSPFFVLKDWESFPDHAEALEIEVAGAEISEEEDRKEPLYPNFLLSDPIMYSHALLVQVLFLDLSKLQEMEMIIQFHLRSSIFNSFKAVFQEIQAFWKDNIN